SKRTDSKRNSSRLKKDSGTGNVVGDRRSTGRQRRSRNEKAHRRYHTDPRPSLVHGEDSKDSESSDEGSDHDAGRHGATPSGSRGGAHYWSKGLRSGRVSRSFGTGGGDSQGESQGGHG
ncbi:unnamed protein product, partial [Discosporangium mesarthrocarpum]